MSLSSEDSLRLNVMIANAVAVRIDEGTMAVHCLSSVGEEAKVQLNPNCRSDQYIRSVRELLSSAVLGSPGGYPVYLKRWTRMGQTSDARLDDLLMLGEPEAVVAVSCAPSLTDEVARKAWWVMPDSENARRMLKRESVVKGEMGTVLADFLLEFLPFEQEPRDIIESVELVLQPGLINDEQRLGIWQRGRQKNVFLIGFLRASPDDLPDKSEARHDLSQLENKLLPLIESGNVFAKQLHRLLSASGQAFLETCEKVLKKPANQDVVVALLEAMAVYYASVRLSPFHYDNVDSIVENVTALSGPSENNEMQSCDELDQLRSSIPELNAEIDAMLVLAHVGEPVVRPIFARTDSMGTVMRKKIEPVSTPVLKQFAVLRGLA